MQCFPFEGERKQGESHRAACLQMTSSPVCRPVGSVKKSCGGVQPIALLCISCISCCFSSSLSVGTGWGRDLPGGSGTFLVGPSLFRPWLWSWRMPCRHPAYLTWLQWNTLLGVHHWDHNLSLFRGNKRIYSCTIINQIPATRVFNSFPQTFIESAFCVPRVFNYFTYVASVPVPFSPSLKIVSYIFLKKILFFVGESRVSGNKGHKFLQERQAWVA